MKIKGSKSIRRCTSNATGSAVATNEPIVRKKKEQDSEYREIGTPELLKDTKKNTWQREMQLLKVQKIRDLKSKGLSRNK